MKCQEVMEYMQRQLDLDLTDSEQQLLDAHLVTCASCRVMMERLQRLTSELSSLPKVHPPVSLVDAILPKLEEIDRARQSEGAIRSATTDQSAETSLANRSNRRAHRLSYKVLGGVVAAGLLLGIAIVNLDQDGSQRVAEDSSAGMFTSSQMSNAAIMNVATSSATGSSASEEAEIHDDTAELMITSEFEVRDQYLSPSSKDTSADDQPVGILAPSGGQKQGILGIPATGGISDVPSIGADGKTVILDKNKSVSGPAEEWNESFNVDLEEMDGITGGIQASVGLASPEGTYSVFIENGSLVVLDSNNERTYVSQSFGDAQVYGLEWTDDSYLTFKVLTDEGEQVYYIDLDKRSEGRM